MWALILGSGACIDDDLARLDALTGGSEPDIVLATNSAGVRWHGPLDHWVTMHTDKLLGLGGWAEQRAAAGYPAGYTTWGTHGAVDRRTLPWGPCDVALLADHVAAYELGYEKIVLCGVPFEGAHADGGTWDAADRWWPLWLFFAERIRERTRSMSGRTRDLLGEPTADWFSARAAIRYSHPPPQRPHHLGTEEHSLLIDAGAP